MANKKEEISNQIAKKLVNMLYIVIILLVVNLAISISNVTRTNDFIDKNGIDYKIENMHLCGNCANMFKCSKVCSSKKKNLDKYLNGENSDLSSIYNTLVSSNIKDYIKENKDATLLIITHHQKVLEYIKPDYVKVLYNGKIVDSGDYKLSLEIEEKGYEKYTTNVDTKE